MEESGWCDEERDEDRREELRESGFEEYGERKGLVIGPLDELVERTEGEELVVWVPEEECEVRNGFVDR